MNDGIRDTFSASLPAGHSLELGQGISPTAPGDGTTKGGPPPLSQHYRDDADEYTEKSNASTLSDDAEDTSLDGQDSVKRIGRNTGRKRVAARGDSDGQDTSEEGTDIKRKARKSARLG